MKLTSLLLLAGPAAIQSAVISEPLEPRVNTLPALPGLNIPDPLALLTFLGSCPVRCIEQSIGKVTNCTADTASARCVCPSIKPVLVDASTCIYQCGARVVMCKSSLPNSATASLTGYSSGYSSGCNCMQTPWRSLRRNTRYRGKSHPNQQSNHTGIVIHFNFFRTEKVTNQKKYEEAINIAVLSSLVIWPFDHNSKIKHKFMQKPATVYIQRCLMPVLPRNGRTEYVYHDQP